MRAWVVEVAVAIVFLPIGRVRSLTWPCVDVLLPQESSVGLYSTSFLCI